jgi:hypothetical protein
LEINTEEYWRDGYTKLHKEYSFHLRENEHMKCQIDLLVHDKMVLDNKVENLQKEIDFWKMIYHKTYDESLKLKLELEENKP